MADPAFYARPAPVTLGALAARLGAELDPPSAADRQVSDVASLASAEESDLTFVVGARILPELERSRSRAVLIDRKTHAKLGAGGPADRAYLIVDDPQRRFADVAELLYPPPAPQPGIAEGAQVAPDAVIAPTAEIGAGAVIGAGARIAESVVIGPATVIGPGCSIGEGTRIGPGCTIAYARIGAGCLLHPGVRIGQDGFGFALGASHRKIPQLGRVLIGDGVEIGANTTVDRGALDDTVIGNGVLIDNLVQIGHNCRIDDGSVIVAQVGLSGGTRLEHHVVMAAQSGAAGHLTIGAGARIGAQCGVMRDVAPGAEMLGSPAEPARQFWRTLARLRRLAERD